MIIEPARFVPDLVDDVLEGLLEPPRSLPPKYFYDARGSELFEQICNTPEYYPTRTEDELLAQHSADIIENVRPGQILELGSGSAQKTRHLFDACEFNELACSYAPFDVCMEILEKSAERLQSDYKWLEVTPLLGDYLAGLDNLPEFEDRRLFLFLGSTIGNFSKSDALQFLNEVGNCMRAGDYLLLGADRVKNTPVLDAAYNDSKGITAEFNLNLLNVLNRELDADFNINNFRHHAIFNEKQNRIEMRLYCIHEQIVHLCTLNEKIHFKTNDKILTEVSHKYTFDGIENLLRQSGFTIVRHYQPDNQYFSLILAAHTDTV